MEIYCDDRETSVTKYATADNIHIRRLTTGDFIIGYQLDKNMIPLVVVERKTWQDLAASLKDGRVNNVTKLREYRERTGAKIAYLLEGSVPSNPSGTIISGIPYSHLRAHLDHLIFTDSIIELHSTSARDSLRRLEEFASHLEKFMSRAAPEHKQDGLCLAMEKRVSTDQDVSDKIWSSFEGISLITARALRAYKVRQLFNDLNEEKFASIVINGRKFGSKRAANLFSILDKKDTFCTLLKSVPGIGLKKADFILERYDKMSDFFSDWKETREKLSGIGQSVWVSLDKFL